MQWLADISPFLGTAFKWLGLVGLAGLVLPPMILAGFVPAQSFAARVSQRIDFVSGGALNVAIGAALLMVIAQLAVVVVRHVFGLAFSWLNELVLYAFAAMFLLAAAGALRDDGHVRVDILRPRFGDKGRAAIELAGAYLFIFPVCLLIFWAASPGLSIAWANLEGSRESDGLPLLFVFKTLIPLFSALLMAQGLSEAIKASLRLRGVRQTPEAAG